MNHHYSMARIVELHGALEKIKDDNGCWNTSPAKKNSLEAHGI